MSMWRVNKRTLPHVPGGRICHRLPCLYVGAEEHHECAVIDIGETKIVEIVGNFG